MVPRRRDDVGNGSVLQDAGRRIAYFQKDLVKCAMLCVAIDQAAQLAGIAKRCQRPVNQPNNLA